jgi:hypothetical protein
VGSERRLYAASRPAPALHCTDCGAWVELVVEHEAWHRLQQAHLDALRDLTVQLTREVRTT